MIKNFSPVPRTRKNLRQSLEKPRGSSYSLTQNELYKPCGYSAAEFHSFSLSFLKIIQEHLPCFHLPANENLLKSMLVGLTDALPKISEKTTQIFSEKYRAQEESLKKTSKVLLKYEELLQIKAKNLEESMKNWQIAKESEASRIQLEKSEVLQSKVVLERELQSALAALKEKEEGIEKQARETEVLRLALQQEKVKVEETSWVVNTQKEKLREQEDILALKEKLFEEDKKKLVEEKCCIENQKMVNGLIAGEFVRSKSKQTGFKRPLSSFTDPWSKSLSPSRSPVLGLNEKVGVNISVEKNVFLNIVNSKTVLSRVFCEVKEMTQDIIPELHKKAENIEKVLTYLKAMKRSVEETLSNLTKKSDEIIEKNKELTKLFENAQEKNSELDIREKELKAKEIRLQNKLNEFENIQQKFCNEVQDFNKEKLDFYEDLANDRRRIEEYYSEIEQKVAFLNKNKGINI